MSDESRISSKEGATRQRLVRKSVLIGHLRRLGIWTVSGRVRLLLASPLCAAIHRAVTQVNTSLLPVDLVLKHTYDYRPVYVDPADIRIIIKPGAWRSGHQRQTTLTRLRDWYYLGGGWKNVRVHVSRNFSGRFIAAGGWDRHTRPLDILPVVAQLFRDGILPEATDDYRKYAAQIEAGQLGWSKGRNIRELRDYFARLIDTFEDMQINGYRSQTEIGEDGSDEIRVCIDRYGRIGLFGGGNHRLSMAKLLQLERVPVLVKRVHGAWVSDWMERIGTESPIEAIEAGIATLEPGSANRLL